MSMKIRKSTFETNSSSTHSLVITESCDLIEQPFGNNKDVDLYLGEFGWAYEKYNSAYDKLSYMMTVFAQCIENQEDVQFSEMGESLLEFMCDKSPLVKDLVEIVEDFTGCKLHLSGVRNSYFYVDHQSSDLVFDELVRGGNWDVDRVHRFLFNRESMLITDNDNH